MNSVDTLTTIKDFIQKKIIEKNILMQLEETQNGPQYVNPYVEVCSLPHKNFLPQGFQVPFIVVMLDDEDDNGNENVYSIRLVFGAYGGGYYKDSNGSMTTVPDAKGYIDLLNLMDIVKQWLVTSSIINNKTVISKPYKKGMYNDENTWPYWYGYSTFSAAGVVENYLIHENLI